MIGSVDAVCQKLWSNENGPMEDAIAKAAVTARYGDRTKKKKLF
jgi:hypothetical protein